MGGQGTGVRVGLFGRLGSGNLGNDASMEAVLAFLESAAPGAVVDCLCSGPQRVTGRYGLPAEQLLWLNAPVVSRSRLVRKARTLAGIALGAVIDTWRISAWVRRHEVVIVPGMGVLESTLPERPWQLPYATFVMAAAGRLFGTKLCLVSVGATVIEQRLTRLLFVTAARLATYRSLRDRDSLTAAVSMGMAEDKDPVYPDLVFSLETPEVSPVLTGAVGVGVMAYYGGPGERSRAEEIHAGYTAKMTRFVLRLAEKGRSVRLLIGDAADEAVVLEILAGVRSRWPGPGQAPVCYDRPDSIDDIMHQLTLVDDVVGTRFHTVLAALKLARPTVAVAYGNKHGALMSAMGVREFVQDIDALDIDALEKQLDALDSDRAHIVRTLAERSRSAAGQLDDQFAVLAADLFENDAVRPAVR